MSCLTPAILFPAFQVHVRVREPIMWSLVHPATIGFIEMPQIELHNFVGEGLEHANYRKRSEMP